MLGLFAQFPLVAAPPCVGRSSAPGRSTRAKPADEGVTALPPAPLPLPYAQRRSFQPRESAHRFSTELRTSQSDFQSLNPEWNQVLERSASPTIFLTWEWAAAWLQAVRPGAGLKMVCVRDACGRLVAVGPFYQTNLSMLGVRLFRGLRVLGDAASGFEYGNIIAERAIGDLGTELVLQFLRDRWRQWDVLWLTKTGPSEEPAIGLASATSRSGMLARARLSEFSRIALPESFEEYLAGLPQKIRYQTRQGVKRLKESNCVLRTATRSDLDEALDDLYRLHAARWAERGGSGVFSEPRLRAFLKALGERMLDRGWFRLDRVMINGRAVAAQVGFAYRGTFYELQRGFDPDFPNIPGGVGAALRSMVIERCQGEGIRTYDFLGGFVEHKRRAGAERTCGRDVMILRPSPVNRLLWRSGLWPTGRYLQFRDTG